MPRPTLAPIVCGALAALFIGTTLPALANDDGWRGERPGAGKPERASVPTVIAHRGASGYLPEHTLAAYWLAIEQGADYVEPDLVSTKDGVLVARHENAIAILDADGTVKEATTDIAERPEFADRRRTKSIDGVYITGWFTEDLTLAELKTLRARERLPQLRTANTRFDGMFEVPTFEEVLQLVAQANERRREDARRSGGPKAAHAVKPIGVYPETKHPSYFDSIKLSLEEPLVRTLHRHGYTGRNAPVIIQSFEVGNLKDLRRMTRVPIAQLLSNGGQPYDFTLKGDRRTYADLTKPENLREIATYADGIGANTGLIVPLVNGSLGTPTSLVKDAHAAGLIVHAWTVRAENSFLPNDFDSSANPADLGNLAGQVQSLLKIGVDGFFTDHPFLGVQARDAFVKGR